MFGGGLDTSRTDVVLSRTKKQPPPPVILHSEQRKYPRRPSTPPPPPPPLGGCQETLPSWAAARECEAK